MKNYFAFFVSCHPFFVFIYFFFTSISRHAFAPRWLLVSAWRNSVVNDGKIWCYFIGLFLTYFEQDFGDPRDADDARYNLDGREVEGRHVTVEFAKGVRNYFPSRFIYLRFILELVILFVIYDQRGCFPLVL